MFDLVLSERYGSQYPGLRCPHCAELAQHPQEGAGLEGAHHIGGAAPHSCERPMPRRPLAVKVCRQSDDYLTCGNVYRRVGTTASVVHKPRLQRTHSVDLPGKPGEHPTAGDPEARPQRVHVKDAEPGRPVGGRGVQRLSCAIAQMLESTSCPVRRVPKSASVVVALFAMATSTIS
jgi:hypothetical protein